MKLVDADAYGTRGTQEQVPKVNAPCTAVGESQVAAYTAGAEGVWRAGMSCRWEATTPRSTRRRRRADLCSAAGARRGVMRAVETVWADALDDSRHAGCCSNSIGVRELVGRSSASTISGRFGRGRRGAIPSRIAAAVTAAANRNATW